MINSFVGRFETHYISTTFLYVFRKRQTVQRRQLPKMDKLLSLVCDPSLKSDERATAIIVLVLLYRSIYYMQVSLNVINEDT